MTNLTDEQKANALAAIYESTALQVIFDILEEICTESENDLIGEAPWSEAVKSKQAVAYAQRAMFQKTTSRVDFLVQGRELPPVAERPKTLDERAEENAELQIVPE